LLCLENGVPLLDASRQRIYAPADFLHRR
jgi:hypothetical protein